MEHVEPQKPTVGRIVLFNSYNEKGECDYPAIVTQVNDDGTLEICTFGPNSVYHQHNVSYSEEPEANHWHWMPYQKQQHAKHALEDVDDVPDIEHDDEGYF